MLRKQSFGESCPLAVYICEFVVSDCIATEGHVFAKYMRGMKLIALGKQYIWGRERKFAIQCLCLICWIIYHSIEI